MRERGTGDWWLSTRTVEWVPGFLLQMRVNAILQMKREMLGGRERDVGGHVAKKW